MTEVLPPRFVPALPVGHFYRVVPCVLPKVMAVQVRRHRKWKRFSVAVVEVWIDVDEADGKSAEVLLRSACRSAAGRVWADIDRSRKFVELQQYAYMEFGE